MPSGREASNAARLSISSTTGDFQLRAINSFLASGGVGAALMIAIISSTLANATARPSNTCARARALRSSNTVRRVTTSRRCRKKASRICFKFKRRGWPSIKATMFMPNVSCNCVCLYRLFKTISGTSPRFSSITTRMPDLSDSSRRSEIPSIFLSRTSSATFSTRFFLFT